jgi:hypothetical protein
VFFVSSVLFIYQTRFGRNGIINIHNQHQWAEKNPHGLIHSRHQQQFNINMRAEIVGDWLVGPHVLPHRLTGNHYRDFLLHDLPNILEAVPLAVTARCGTCVMVLQHTLVMLCEIFSITPIMTDG